MPNKGPMKISLVKGQDYYWCACGKSAAMPFCSGAHKGSGIGPKPFKAEKEGDAYLCTCQKTKNPPYCDGSHKA